MSSPQQLPYHLSPARAHILHDQTQTLPPSSPTAPASPACPHTHFSHNPTMSHTPAVPEIASSSQYRYLADSGYRLRLCRGPQASDTPPHHSCTLAPPD